MNSFRIAHISDLHISPDHKRLNIRNTKRLLEHIKRLKVDHLVVTGDIAANADKDDFHIARNLFDAAGMLDSRFMSVVIGNHDVFGGVHTPEDILQFPQRCRKVDVGKKAQQFREHFQELFRNTCSPSEKQPFPYLKPIGDLLIIGLNSVTDYSPLKNPVGSNGRVGERQQRQLDQMLSSREFKRNRTIVLIHHHFNKMAHQTNGTMQSVWKAFEQQTMKLHKKSELVDLFKKHQVDAVLHGHYHENMEYTRKGLRFINGGGSILGPVPSVLHLNVLHLGSKEVRVEHHEFPMIEEHPRVRALGQGSVILTGNAAA